MFGKPLVVSNVKLLIVISRPRITILSFATRTKRFIRWKTSARSKKLPSNSKSSGMLSRPGAAVPASPEPAAPAAPGVPAAAPEEAFAFVTALPADCAAWPGPLAAGAAPGAAGLAAAPPPGVVAAAGVGAARPPPPLVLG